MGQQNLFVQLPRRVFRSFLAMIEAQMQKLNLYFTEYIVQNACDKSEN